MAGSYILPQTRVFQEFSQTPNDVTQSLNPFIIGPNYQLIRYAHEDERVDCSYEEFVGADKEIKWASGASGTVVDKSWYGVTFEKAYVKLSNGTLSGTALDKGSDGNATKFEFQPDAGKSLAGVDSAKLQFGVSLRVGDYLAYTVGVEKKYARIREISIGRPRTGEWSWAIKQGTSDKSDMFAVDASGYKGERSVTVTLTVSGAAGGSQTIKCTSSAPGFTAADFTFDSTLHAIGTTGVQIGKKASGTSVDPGTYTLKLTVPSGPYVSDTVTVSDFVSVGTGSTVAKDFTFVRFFDSIDCLPDSLVPGDSGVTVNASAYVDIGVSSPYAVYAATAYLNQRNLRTDHVDHVYSVRSDSDVVSELGAYNTPDNPLAYAAHIMLLNNANTAIKFIGVRSDDADGYAEALKRASLTTDVYAFCPLTEDRAILDSIVADCNRLSAPEEKSWRIAIFSMPTDDVVDVTPRDSTGTAEECTVTSAELTCVGRGAATASTISKFTDTVAIDDEVQITTGAGILYTRKVVAVVTDNRLTLDRDVAGASSPNCRLTILHSRNRGELVEAIAETSASFRDRRAYNVFPNRIRASDGNEVSGMYAAAAVCALTCSVAPQQPITNVEIKGFSDLPDVYSKFSRDELNEIAAGGTLILMQEKPGGTVYVRHQISTAYRDGNLNTTELSLTKNLDSISYYFANRTSPYIGRYNITDDLLTELRGVIEDGLTHLETTTETNKLVGPQIIAEGTEIRSLYRSAEKDKAYCDVALNLPAPFNNFDLHLQVI